MNRPELIIFDWDGTLFNSVGQIVASLQFAAQRFEQPLTHEAAQGVIGLGLPEVMQTLFPQVPHLHEQIVVAYGEHYVQHSAHDAWFDGVAELLHDLKAMGMKLAVATGKNRRGLDRVLTKTQSHHIFDITRAASETMSKPHPRMLEEILQVTEVEAKNAIMVGDSSYDLEMAMNIDMPRIGVSYGVHDPQVLARYAPLTIVKSVPELHHFLKQILQQKMPA
ncbi:HAD-IA family hydrolase [Acinetobacter soli]|uniref:HAD-IA family hydrolase n=1 Tax=Acinetobacter soli TaxID=487316 RepID=UPI00370CAE1C